MRSPIFSLPTSPATHDPLLERIWELRGNCIAYNAAYLALAEVLGATLVTSDRKLAKVAGETVRVDVM